MNQDDLNEAEVSEQETPASKEESEGVENKLSADGLAEKLSLAGVKNLSDKSLSLLLDYLGGEINNRNKKKKGNIAKRRSFPKRG